MIVHMECAVTRPLASKRGLFRLFLQDADSFLVDIHPLESGGGIRSGKALDPAPLPAELIRDPVK